MIEITADLKAKLGNNTHEIDFLQYIHPNGGKVNNRPVSKIFKDAIIEGATFENYQINKGVVTIIKNIE